MYSFGAFRPRFSATGLLLGTLFFAFSLTPSLLPRTALLQGIVAGSSLAAGYAVGVFAYAVWRYLEIPEPTRRVERLVKIVAAAICLITAGVFLWKASDWQDSVRAVMGMEPVEGTRPVTVGVIAALLFGVLWLIARLFRHTYLRIATFLHRFIPRRISHAVGLVIAVALFLSVADGVLYTALLSTADRYFQQVDAMIRTDAERPLDPLDPGSAESLLDWGGLGSAGREFVVSGPTAADIGAFLSSEAREPIRVYVGLNSADTVAERAQLALAELRRVGAFDRSVLVIATPTGTGWLDPAAMDTVEYLHRGDIASVAVQYSYLPSALSLLAEGEYGVATARAVFAEVYEYWSELPRARRPKLYLHGVSLGAMNSDRSFDFFDVVGDVFQGALWTGPPFRSETWRSVTEQRVSGTPVWLPRFRDSSVVRFTNQDDHLSMPGVPWGPLRIAYLQYASDPLVFFDPRMLYRRPEWLDPPRGPDVTPELRWMPIVTMLQVLADMRAGHVTPVGYGHKYAPRDYIRAWIALTEPEGWTEHDTRRLESLFAAQPK